MRQTKPKPPDHLSDEMQKLWRKLVSDYDFSVEHLHILRVTCEAFDRTQAARRQIAADGMILDDKRHPLIGVEAKSTELFLRGLRDLQLEGEAGDAKKT
jgi:phage terminase small subunit